MKRSTAKTKMKFYEDADNPTRKKKPLSGAPDGKVTNLRDLLPTKNGIYKPTPLDPPGSKEKKRKPKKKPGHFVSRDKRGGAVWAMKKTVKRKQKGKGIQNPFRKWTGN